LEPLIKKVFFIFLISMVIIWILIALPYLMPKTELSENPYPWFTLGADSIRDLLWDPDMNMFRESPHENQSYWIDDNAKLLNMFLEDPVKYQSEITNIIENLHKVYHNGYFPRRYVKTNPKIVNSDPKNMRIENGFLRLSGNLSNPYDKEHPLTLTYYEASGKVDFAYMSGQLFTVYPKGTGLYYNWITYDPIRIRADQCQNPGFDANGSLGTDPALDLMPWEFSHPKYWNFAENPPFHCVYTTKFAFNDTNQHKRVIGLEVDAEGSEKDWRSDEFSITANTTYTFSFYYRGKFTSGTPFRVYVRWFDASHNWISENYTSYNSTTTDWEYTSYSVTSPNAGAYADIRIVAYGDTVGNYYFDKFSLSGANVPNGDFEIPNLFNFRTDVYRTQYRCGHLYGANEYLRQPLYVPITVSQFHNLTWYVKVGASTNYYVYVWYSDGTYTQISKSCSSTDKFVKDLVNQNELTAGKTIVAIGFVQQTANVDVFIDDVGIHYKPSGASYNAWVDEEVSPYNSTRLYVEAVQSYEDNDVNLTIRFRFSLHQAYLTQIMKFQNKHSDYKTGILFHNAFDGLSTIITGEGSMRTAYSSVWIPEIGRRSPDPDLAITTLFYPEERWKWATEHDYFIVELKQIPEWSGCLGLAVKVSNWALHDIMNTRSDNTTLWGEDTGKYLHYLTYSFEFEVLENETKDLTTKILCLNGYDFTNPSVYDHYFMNLENYPDLDLSMNYHIGMIVYTLAKYLQIQNIDPYGMAEGSWSYYKHTFTSHDNGSYLMTTGKMIEASMILYRVLDQEKYLNFAKQLADYLVNDIQLSDGRFPMKHNNVTYLDCQGVCVIGLRLMQDYDSTYKTAYQKGLSAIHYGFKPYGYHRIPVGYVGDNVPDEKRLFVYANSTHIDDDFWTYKASYVARASLGENQTLTILGLSRVWSRTAWNATHLFIWNSESTPEHPISWITPLYDTNSETQPWGLITWLEIAKHQRHTLQYYFEFLKEHKAILYADLTQAHANYTVYAPNEEGTISTFYLKGEEEYAVPTSVKVDGVEIPKTSDPNVIPTASSNIYYYNASAYELVIKAFVQSNEKVNVFVALDIKTSGLWMPITPMLASFGLILMMISPVYLILKIKEGEFADALGISFMMFIIGFAFIMGWLWG